jgi:hypothetical protein
LNGFNAEKFNEEKREIRSYGENLGRKTPLELGFMQAEKYNTCHILTSIAKSLVRMVVMLNFKKMAKRN